MRYSIYQCLRRLLPQHSIRPCAPHSCLLSSIAERCIISYHVCQHVIPAASTSSRRFLSTAATTAPRSLISPDHIVHSPIPDLDIPTNLPFHEFIFQKCDEFRDLDAIEDFLTGKKYTYSQLKEKTIKVASGLHKLGFRKGDVVTAFSTNTVDFTVLMLACSATGIWFSPANPAFTAEELSRQLNHNGSLAVFTKPEMTEVVKEALANQQFPNKVKCLFVFGESTGFQPFQALLDDDGKSFPDVDINPLEDVYTLPYSSGTTGLPKGVMLTHNNCLANCMQIFAASTVTPDYHCLGLLPLYHIYGMIVVQFAVMLGGARLTYLPKFKPEIFLCCLQDRKITMAHLVPPLVVFLAKNPLVSNYNLTSLKKIICGAAPLGADVTKELLQRLNHGLVVNQAYGMTETSPVTNVDSSETHGSIGPMVANTLGKIVDLETNQVLGPGKEGELCVKGPQVMKGYYNNQKATDEMIEPDGWLHTGDIAYFDQNGLIYIQDRLKELIKYKGSQVAPAELEALLLGHPDIHDVAVIGVPDEEAGELPKAFVVKNPGSTITEEEIVKFVEARVAHTKRLRGGVQFIDEIPKNPSGKILRRILKTQHL